MLQLLAITSLSLSDVPPVHPGATGWLMHSLPGAHSSPEADYWVGLRCCHSAPWSSNASSAMLCHFSFMLWSTHDIFWVLRPFAQVSWSFPLCPPQVVALRTDQIWDYLIDFLEQCPRLSSWSSAFRILVSVLRSQLSCFQPTHPRHVITPGSKVGQNPIIAIILQMRSLLPFDWTSWPVFWILQLLPPLPPGCSTASPSSCWIWLGAVSISLFQLLSLITIQSP